MVEADEVWVPFRANAREFEEVARKVERKMDEVEKKGGRSRGGGAFLGGAIGGFIGGTMGAATDTLLGPLLEILVNLLVATLLPLVEVAVPFLANTLGPFITGTLGPFITGTLGPFITDKLFPVLQRILDWLQGGENSMISGVPEGLGGGGTRNVFVPLIGPVQVPRTGLEPDTGADRREEARFWDWMWRGGAGGDPDHDGGVSGTRSGQITNLGDFQ